MQLFIYRIDGLMTFDLPVLSTVFDWVLGYWHWALAGILSLLATLVGVANHRLPSHDDVAASYFINEDLGENNRLWRLLAQFCHEQDPQATAKTDAHFNDVVQAQHPRLAKQTRQKLSGVYAIDDGREALNVRVLLTQIAQRSLDLQYYMWHDDASGRLLFYEVWQAAERGVRVRLLLDDNNTVGMDAVLQTLDSHPNIDVRLFNPFMNRRFRILGYLTALKRLNRRMHNKSFTVDNQATIFGGRNIGDEYFDINEKVNFADLDVLAIGEVVNEVSTDFDRYWNSAASFPVAKIIRKQHTLVDLSKTNHQQYTTQTARYRQALSDSDFLDNLEQGLLRFLWVNVRFVSDPPTKALPDVLLKHNHYPHHYRHATNVTNAIDTTTQNDATLIEQIASTLLSPKKSLTIVSPYFVPSQLWTASFVNLAKRGIELNILTNSLTANDVIAVHAGYMRYRKALLLGRVNLFELKSKRSSRLIKKSWAKRPLDRASRHYRRQHKDHHRWLNRSTASLHAKTFSVDGELLFVGSFNFDPRSAAVNTELGAIIESPVLAQQLDDMIEKWTKELSYVVSIDNDKLAWTDQSLDPLQTFDNEPDSNWRQRCLVWLIGKLPIEDFL